MVMYKVVFTKQAVKDLEKLALRNVSITVLNSKNKKVALHYFVFLW